MPQARKRKKHKEGLQAGPVTAPKPPASLLAVAARVDRLAATRWALPAALAVLTVAVHARSIGFSLVYWDDQVYLLDDPRLEQLSFRNVWRILTESYFANYHPITTLTYAFDRAVWGTWLPGFRLTQLALYASGVVLLYYMFRAIRLKRWAAFAAAAVYATHTIHVEAVAWLAQRKDVVCLVFYVSSILTYIYYAQDRNKKSRFYAASIALGAAAMLSKGYAVVLPGILLAYDACFGKRIRRRQLVDKIPFVVLAIPTVALTVAAQDKATALIPCDIPWWQRLLLLGHVFAAYVGRAILPIGLCAKYPIKPGLLNTGAALLGLALGGGAIAGFLLLRRRLAAAAFGIALFVLPLATVMNTFFTLSIWMADRYLLFPTIGSSLGLTVAVIQLCKRRSTPPLTCRLGVSVAAICTVGLYAALTVSRLGVWQNSVTFWSDVFRKENGIPGSGPVTARELRDRGVETVVSARTLVALASGHRRAGDIEESKALVGVIEGLSEDGAPGGQFLLADRDIRAGRPDAAIRRLRPIAEGDEWLTPDAWTRMGVAHGKMGNSEAARRAHLKAIDHYHKRNRPATRAMMNLGLLEMSARRFEEAAEWFRCARKEARPTDPRPLLHLGACLEKMGQLEDAKAVCEETLRLEDGLPTHAYKYADTFAKTHQQLGGILEKLGRSNEAVRHLAEFVRRAPDNPQRADIHLEMARIEERLDHFEESIRHYEVVLRLVPDHSQRGAIQVKMGLLENKLGHTEEAISHLKRGLPLASDRVGKAEIHLRIAAAEEERGRLRAAIRHLEEARHLTPNRRQQAETHLKIGIAQEKLGDPEKAVGHYREVLHLAPGHPQRVEIRLKLGLLEKELNHVEEAVHEFEEVLRMAPGHPQRAGVRLEMGLLEEKLGHVEKAIQCLEESIRLAPTHSRRESVEAKIDELRARLRVPHAAPQP